MTADILKIIALPVLTPGHRMTLILLHLHPNGLSMAELLALTAMAPGERATMQRWLKVLIERGYVTRRMRRNYPRDVAHLFVLATVSDD